MVWNTINHEFLELRNVLELSQRFFDPSFCLTSQRQRVLPGNSCFEDGSINSHLSTFRSQEQ